MSDAVVSNWAAAGHPDTPETMAEAPVESMLRVRAANDPVPLVSEPAGSVPAAPEPSVSHAPSFASLLDRARTAQAQLSAQPLPIANRDLLLIQKLFGG